MHGLHFAYLFVFLSAHSVLSLTFEEIKALCKIEHNFDGDLLNMNFNDPIFPKEAKCELACWLEKKDGFKIDGSIDRVKVKELTEEVIKNEDVKKKFLKAIDECDVTAKADECDTAYEFIKCKKNKGGMI